MRVYTRVLWFFGFFACLQVVHFVWTPVSQGVPVPHSVRSLPILWLGNCNETKGSEARLTLIRSAFPERDVRHTLLSSTCGMMSSSEHSPDIVFVMGWGFEDEMKHAISVPRKKKKERLKDSFDDLIYLHKSNLEPPHTPNRTFVLATQEEWWGGESAFFDVLVDSKVYGHSGGVGLYWPFGSRVFAVGFGTNSFYRHVPQDLVLPPNFNAAELRRAKTGFVAFANSNCDTDWYGDATNTVRAALFDYLSAHYKPATALGQCRSADENKPICNHRKTDDDCMRRGRFVSKFELDDITDQFKDFKFVIAMENHLGPSITDLGYWTEKVVEAVMARAVPIYAGHTPSLPKYFTDLLNPDGLIYCQFDHTQFSGERFNASDREARVRHTKENGVLREQLLKCVEKIRAVDQNDELWERMVSTPFLPNNQVQDSVFDINRVGRNIRKAACLLKSHLCAHSAMEHPAP